MPIKYNSVASRHIDFGYVYFFTLLIVYFIVTSIIDNYNREKLLTVKHAEQLEIANQSKTKLFSIMAHDLRSPLNSIQSFLELLLDYDIEETEKRNINTALLKETKNTSQMLFNLLSWSKTQMDGMTVNLIDLNLSDALEPTLLMQTGVAAEKGILLNNQLQAGVSLIADSDMLEIVIRNLLNNAIKFTPTGGEITIKSEIHGSQCWITVQDTGVGIDNAAFEDIFSLHSESTYGTNNEKGVGLGLVLCKEYISLQQGKIWMESIVGVGTTFFVSLDINTHLCDVKIYDYGESE